MDCIIPGANIKVVSKAVQSLSKIGDHLKLIPEKDHLSFRCLNTNKTAYCTINFNESFFSSYNLDGDVGNNLHCIISVKALLGIFKHQTHKDNKPEYFKIELAYGENEIIFKTKYKYDIVVVRSLRLSDVDISNVNFTAPQIHNQIVAPASLFIQVLTNFQLGDDDFGIETKLDKAILRNYDAESRYSSKGIRSQLTLNASEFKTFQIENETSITFSQKTFKAVINFAEAFNLDVILNFEKAGRPCFIILGNSTFEANFLVATISSDDALQNTVSTTCYSVNQKIIRHCDHTEEQDTCEDDSQSSNNKRRRFDFVMNEVQDSNGDGHKERDNLSVNLPIPVTESENNQVNNVEVLPDSFPKSPSLSQVQRVNTVFGRCYDITFRQTNVDLGEVLAADSDPDSDDN